MKQAVRELSHRPSKNYWGDLIAGDGPLVMMEHWSALSESGVMGDPTKASAEKGRAFFDAAADGIVELVDEMRARAPAVRRDHH
jgi:creatinine amidohydrolase